MITVIGLVGTPRVVPLSVYGIIYIYIYITKYTLLHASNDKYPLIIEMATGMKK